jgi:hypothetical protein
MEILLLLPFEAEGGSARVTRPFSPLVAIEKLDRLHLGAKKCVATNN